MSQTNFTTDPTVILNSAYPAGVSQQAVLASLHNHDTFIRATSTNLISYERVSGTVALDSPVTYTITDKKPIGKATITLVITNRAGGVDTQGTAKSPIGSMVVESRWVAAPTEIQERIWISANKVVTKLVKSTTEKTHPEAHKVIFSDNSVIAVAA